LQNTVKTGGQNLVAIGGGTGLSTLLAGLKKRVGKGGEQIWIENLSAIVTVSDDGGSSGRLREELQMLPPGDIRNCMIALSEDSSLLAKLFRYRFRGEGELGGHSFGNLFLAAMTEITGGDFTEAIRLSSEILASKGHIFPATISDVRLVAELEDGSVVSGETQISRSSQAIRHLRLEPELCLPLPQVLKAIRAADIITVGPGSLYTSILPNLLVAQVARVIGQSQATKIFVNNLMTQPGETDGYTARAHLEAVKKYAPEIHFDFVIVNNRRISAEQAERYAAEGAYQIGIDDPIDDVVDQSTEIVRADLLDSGEKVRHNAEQLAEVVLGCRERVLSEVTVSWL
jgi:uncharacterized cofD-like protein